MTEISKRLENLIGSTQKKLILKNQILPIKTDDGILVGEVLIVSEGNIKHIIKNNEVIFLNVYLNAVAIKLANICNKNPASLQAQKIYDADQDYGRWFTDSQILRTQYNRAIEKRNFDRADMLYSRYTVSRDRAEKAKNIARALAGD